MTSFDPYYQWMAIPPGIRPPDHYQLLGLQPFEQNIEVVQHAADARMRHIGSFSIGPHAELSQRLLTEVSAARVCLSNATAKAAYDQALRAKLSAQMAPVAQPVAQPVAAPSAAVFEPAPATSEHFSVVSESRSVKKASALSKWMPLLLVGALLLVLGFVVQKLKSSAPQPELAAGDSSAAGTDDAEVEDESSTSNETEATNDPDDAVVDTVRATSSAQTNPRVNDANDLAAESRPGPSFFPSPSQPQTQAQPPVRRPAESSAVEDEMFPDEESSRPNPGSAINPPVDRVANVQRPEPPMGSRTLGSLVDEPEAESAVETPSEDVVPADLVACTPRQRKVLHQALVAMLMGDIATYQRVTRSIGPDYSESGTESKIRVDLLKDMEEAATVYWGELRTTLDKIYGGAVLVSEKGARAMVVEADAQKLVLRAGGVNKVYTANPLGVFPTLKPELVRIIFEQHGRLDARAFPSIGFFESIRKAVAGDSMADGEERWEQLLTMRNESKDSVYGEPVNNGLNGMDPRFAGLQPPRPDTTARPPVTAGVPVTPPPTRSTSFAPRAAEQPGDWDKDATLVCKFDCSTKVAYANRYTKKSADEIVSAKIVRINLGGSHGDFSVPKSVEDLEFGRRKRIELNGAGVPVRLEVLLNDEEGVTVETKAFFTGNPRRPEPIIIADLTKKKDTAKGTIPDRQKEFAEAQRKLKHYVSELKKVNKLTASNATAASRKAALVHSTGNLVARTQKQLTSIAKRGETTTKMVNQLEATIPFGEGLAEEGYVTVVFSFK